MKHTIIPNLATGLPQCALCAIRDKGICSRSGEAELDWLDQHKVLRTYEAGTAIAWAGDELNFVGTIMQGHASLSRIDEDGERQTIGLMHPSHFIGRPDRKVVQFDIEAVTDLELCTFNYVAFKDFLETSPDMQARLLEYMLDELDAARSRMLLLGRKSALEKVASYIVELCLIQFDASTLIDREGPILIDLLLNRHMLADYLSLSMETVSRQFSALERQGLIRSEPNKMRIAVLDFHGLYDVSGNDEDGGLYD